METRELAAGVFLWLLLGAVFTLLRGVRWDETFEYAQAITGNTPYPEGHPFLRFSREALSLQTYASAWLIDLGGGPAIVCGVRNYLYLVATTVPVFLLTAALSRRTVVGHAGALLFLLGILHEFDGAYPLSAWPALGSIGHIGMGYALFILALLALGRSMEAFFLLGLMPAFHLGQTPVLGLLAAGFGIAVLRRKEAPLLVRNLIPFVAALVLAGAFAWHVSRAAETPDPKSPYGTMGDTEAIWRTYVSQDGHRTIPLGRGYENSHFALACTILLGLGLHSLLVHDPSTRRRSRWILAYGAGAAAIVWGIAGLHLLVGNAIPYVLIVWLPYRLANHALPILLALSLACLSVPVRPASSSRLSASGLGFICGLVLFAACRPLLESITAPQFYARYLATGAIVFYVLIGAASVRVAFGLRDNRTFALGWSAVLLAVLALFARYHQFGALAVAFGAAAMALVLYVASRNKTKAGPSKRPESLLVAACFLALGIILIGEARNSSHLPIDDSAMAVRHYLQTQSKRGGLVAAAPKALYLQARLDHAVLDEFNLESHLSYLPRLGPAIFHLYEEVYGMDLWRHEGRQGALPWEEVWKRRTRSDWGDLAKRYSIDYVLVWNGLPLDLSVAFQKDATILYDAGQ